MRFFAFRDSWLLLAIAAVWLGPTATYAQVKFPKPPAKYDVDIRYRIVADRNERIRQFDAMLDYFTKLGFKETPTEDSDLASFDPTAERIYGTIPSENARALLRDPRVQTVMLRPPGYMDPANADERVKVQIDLSGGLPLEEQRLLSRQSAQALAQLGFVEATSYDHRGFTRLRGTVPAGNLQYLIKDLRRQPQGWFVPEKPPQLFPEPFASVLAVRFVGVTPEPEGTPAPIPPVPAPKVNAPPGIVAKLGPSLRRMLEQDATAGPVRLEVTLVTAPDPFDLSWRREFLRVVGDARIEGLMGATVTLSLPQAGRAANIAGLPFVDAVILARLATPAHAGSPPAKPKEDAKEKAARLLAQPIRRVAAEQAVNADPLKLTRLDALHSLNFRGAGVRIVLVDSDFSGYERFVGRVLPKSTKLIDMTAERDSNIRPDPLPPAASIGHGTHCALAAVLAAPEAEFTLVRVDPAVPHEVYALARYVRGDVFMSEAIRSRRDEIEGDINYLNRRRVEVNDQYRRAFESFEDDPVSVDLRRKAVAAVEEHGRQEKALLERINRLSRLEAELTTLKGAQIISCPFVWNSGHPLESNGALSRYLNENYILPRPPVVVNGYKQSKPALWFQAAGDTRGQSWCDEFRDVDHNGVMEFVPRGSLIPVDRWTPELNFLGFIPDRGKDAVLDLPDAIRLRITIQWREPHDPALPEDYYREPIAPLRLMLLRQRDPTGTKLPTDELETIAVSSGSALRLAHQPGYGIYEQGIDVMLPAGGRYALRVDGRKPRTVRPAELGTLPALEQEWELRPRLFVETVSGPPEGRVVLWDFPSSAGGVGMAADSRAVFTVGAATRSNRTEPFSAIGAAPAAELMTKPDIWAYDELPSIGEGPAKGTAIAGAFAAGMSASLLSAGASDTYFLRSVGVERGQLFQIPSGWLPHVRKK